MKLNQVTLPVHDVEAAVEFYRRLGCTLIVHSPHYARFQAPEGDATFSVHRVDEVPVSPWSVLYFESGRLDETVRALEARGVVFDQAPRDEPWLWREARLRDPSGNVLCLYRAGDNRLSPPWRVGE